MVELNEKQLRDKIHACWIGKNIGGTMGGPHEGKREILDIKELDTTKGTLPNDDLDLQLVWLRAIEEYGPYHFSEQILSEYWISFIAPHWNEYGVCRSNLINGLYPPMSGEYKNSKWKTSNGAWIRSEIWACLAPGFPEIANKYAYMDACVDHGVSEGTYAELFITTMESMAFFEHNIRKCIEAALRNIPEHSLLSKSVRLAIGNYDNGMAWEENRNRVVELSREIGWFQAPANVAFVIIGVLYGEGDFKRSMLFALNCGDDTDCTAATVGAFLGIVNGMKGIPAQWADFVGDGIKTIAVSADCYDLPATCTALTDRIMRMIPVMFKANGANVIFTSGENRLDHSRELASSEGISWKMSDRGLGKTTELWKKNPYSFSAFDTVWATAFVEFESEPVIEENGELKASLVIKNNLVDQRYLYFNVYLPEGWTAEYKKSIFMDYPDPGEPLEKDRAEVWSVVIHADENVKAHNRVIVEVTGAGRSSIGLVPITILG